MSMDLLVMRLADMTRVHPQQDNSHVCSKCGAQVGIYPSGQNYMKQYPDITLTCNRCAVSGPIPPPSAEIVQEIKDSVWKK